MVARQASEGMKLRGSMDTAIFRSRIFPEPFELLMPSTFPFPVSTSLVKALDIGTLHRAEQEPILKIEERATLSSGKEQWPPTLT